MNSYDLKLLADGGLTIYWNSRLNRERKELTTIKPDDVSFLSDLLRRDWCDDLAERLILFSWIADDGRCEGRLGEIAKGLMDLPSAEEWVDLIGPEDGYASIQRLESEILESR